MAAAVAGQPLQQRGVHRPVDADGKDPAVPRLLVNLTQQRILVTDLTIGDEQQDALPVRFGRRGEIPQGAGQGGGDLGAVAGLDPGQELHRPEPDPIGGGHQPSGAGRGLFQSVIEQDQPEPVPLGQGVDQPRRRPPRRHHLPAAHRSGAVEQHPSRSAGWWFPRPDSGRR